MAATPPGQPVARTGPVTGRPASAAQLSVEAAVRDFAAAPGRSAVVESVRGIPVRAAVLVDAPRPGASILKLPLVGAVATAAGSGQLDLGREVSVPVRSTLPSILRVFEPGHRFSLAELCRICLATSDNPIASYLLGLVGFAAVNREAARWGCEATMLSVGFDDARLGADGRRNVTTARDALVLVRAVIEARPEWETALANGVRNTRIPLRLPLGVRAAHKTGTLPGVVNDVGVVFGEQTDLALAFLCEDEHDPGVASNQIGDCVARVRLALGESAREPAP